MFDFRNVFDLGTELGSNPPPDPNPLPPRWGPASYWRLGLAVLGGLIAVILLWRLFA